MKKEIKLVLVSIVHFLISLLWREKIFLSITSSDIQKYSLLGDDKDVFMFKTAAWIVSAVLLFVFWQFLGWLFSERSNGTFRRFFIIFAVFFLILILMLFPTTFWLESDNLTVYTAALYGRPVYWHSYFTGAVYLAILFDFYHPIAIPIFQACSFSACYAFFCHIVYLKTDSRRLRVIAGAGVLLPYVFYVALNPYRNCFYTILVIWMMLCMFDIYYSKKDLTIQKCVEIALTGGVLSFWRSEGVLYLVLLPVLLCILFGRREVKKIIYVTISIFVLYYIGNMPQKIAVEKYYGNDYMIVNMISMLSDCMNDSQFHDEYKGYQEDMNTISEYYDPLLIKDYHSMAYQFGNYLKGNQDVSRSFLNKAEQTELMNAIADIILHNKTAFIKGRLRLMAKSLGLLNKISLTKRTIQIDEDMIYKDIFTFGRIGGDLLSAKSLLPQNVNYVLMDYVWMKGISVYMDKMNIVQSFVWVMCIGFGIIVIIDSLIQKKLFYAGCGGVIYSMLAAVCIFAPESREAYYYPVFYQLFILEILFLADFEKKQNNNPGETSDK